MNFQAGTIIEPLPTEEDVSREEKFWRVNLPNSYREFIKKYGGGIPEERSFVCGRHEYAIDRFLSIINNYETNYLGMYDIGVILTQIEERLTDNMDLIGVEVLPIAVLFAGDLICLDYRRSKENPSICLWNHEESGVFSPVTYEVSSSFETFLKMLH